MSSREAQLITVVALLAPRFLHGRAKLGQKFQELVQQRPDIKEFLLEDGTARCPRICLAAQQGAPPPPAAERLRVMTWQRDGREVPHVLLCFTPQEFLRAADDDGLASVLHAAEDTWPGYRLHLLTYAADSSCKPLWQLVSDLAVWRPDVAFHCARNVDEAAEHMYRVTRAVAEEDHKRTTTRSFLSVQPQSAAVQQKLQQLETLLVRHSVQRNGSGAACMRALLTLPGVSAEVAYAAGLHFGSLQRLLEATERNGTAHTADVIAALPLPASTVVVGPAAANRIVQLAAQ